MNRYPILILILSIAPIMHAASEKITDTQAQNRSTLTPRYKPAGTYLTRAIFEENLRFVTFILNYCPKLALQCDDTGETPLTLSVKRGNVEMVRIFSDARVALFKPNREQKTPLFLALELGHSELAELLLKAALKAEPGTEPTKVVKQLVCTRHGNTPIHLFAEHNAPQAVFLAHAWVQKHNLMWLMTHRDSNGRTPLFIALTQGHTEIADELIAVGANLFERAENDETAFHFLTRMCKIKHIKKILRWANERKHRFLRSQNDKGNTPLMLAVMTASPRIVYAYKDQPDIKEAINIKNHKGETALFLSLELGELTIASALVAYGADATYIKDTHGRSPLHKLLKTHATDKLRNVIAWLQQYQGEHFNICDIDVTGTTLLRIVTCNESEATLALFEILIQQGAANEFHQKAQDDIVSKMDDLKEARKCAQTHYLLKLLQDAQQLIAETKPKENA